MSPEDWGSLGEVRSLERPVGQAVWRLFGKWHRRARKNAGS